MFVRSDSEEGMVTVENALGLGGVVLVVLALILAITAGQTHASMCHAAREGARAHSLGQDASAAANSVVGRQVQVAVSGAQGWFTTTATTPGLRLGGWSTMPISCEVRAFREPHSPWSDL